MVIQIIIRHFSFRFQKLKFPPCLCAVRVATIL